MEGRDGENGEENYNAKHTEPEVIEMRKLYGSKKKRIFELVEMFNSKHYTVSAIVRRKSWKHIAV